MGVWATAQEDEDGNGPFTGVKVRNRLKRCYMDEGGGVCDVGEWDWRWAGGGTG